ncbi:MAG: hypothetical protein IJ138_02800 [Clostridia bacterium]|nr:hypothetical protein [Clostridia bacterium]
MKYLFRLIGFIVVIGIVAALALYTLNSFGYLHGSLSKWINDVANHCQGTVNDTMDFLENQDYIPFPTAAPSTEKPVLTFQEP